MSMAISLHWYLHEGFCSCRVHPTGSYIWRYRICCTTLCSSFGWSHVAHFWKSGQWETTCVSPMYCHMMCFIDDCHDLCSWSEGCNYNTFMALPSAYHIHSCWYYYEILFLHTDDFFFEKWCTGEDHSTCFGVEYLHCILLSVYHIRISHLGVSSYRYNNVVNYHIWVLVIEYDQYIYLYCSVILSSFMYAMCVELHT